MRPTDLHFDPTYNNSRWVAYFDLLGMRELIRANREFEVFIAYQTAIRRLNAQAERQTHELMHAWFSDSFLLFTKDDSGSSLASIESISRWFMYFLIEARIPLRGAIAAGHMYADPSHRVFFGPAMIDAYEYGEGQDWIGLILRPSARSQMETLNLFLPRLNYALWQADWKRPPPNAPAEVGACLFWQSNARSGNVYLDRLRELASLHVGNSTIHDKYARAIAFIEANPRRFSDDPN